MHPAESARLQKEANRRVMTTTLCACGCGAFTRRGRGVKANRFIRGHACKGRTFNYTPEHPHPNFKGGRRTNRLGYTLVLHKDHHRASYGYVHEHILIAETALGRPLLAQHPVHHVDKNRSNNANSNLVICEDTKYHALLHRRQRAKDFCGDPDARPCGFCKKYDLAEKMITWGSNQGHYAHAQCAQTYQREWRAKRRTV